MSKEVYKVVFVSGNDPNFIVTYHVEASDWKQAGEKAVAFNAEDYPLASRENIDFKITLIEITDIVLI